MSEWTRDGMNRWASGNPYAGNNPCPTCGSLPTGRETVNVGDVLHGFCGGEFGRDPFGCKTVEAVGPDWVVARVKSGYGVGAVLTAMGNGIRVDLARYLIREDHGLCDCDDD